MVVYQTIWATNDPSRIGALLSARAAAGVATTDTSYEGQFSYAARLAEPVRVLRAPEDLPAWIAGHPGGVLLTRQAVDLAGLRLLTRDVLHGDDWFAYQVGDGT